MIRLRGRLAAVVVALVAIALVGCAGGWSGTSLKSKLASDPAVISVVLEQSSSIDLGNSAQFTINMKKNTSEVDVARVAETIRTEVPKSGDGPLVNIYIRPETPDSSSSPNLHLENFGMGKKALSKQIEYWGRLRGTFGTELARFELTASFDLGDPAGNRFVGVTLPSTTNSSEMVAGYVSAAGVADPAPIPTQWEIKIPRDDPLRFDSDGGKLSSFPGLPDPPVLAFWAYATGADSPSDPSAGGRVDSQWDATQAPSLTAELVPVDESTPIGWQRLVSTVALALKVGGDMVISTDDAEIVVGCSTATIIPPKKTRSAELLAALGAGAGKAQAGGCPGQSG